MSDGRYNIPRQYKVDKGMPLDMLFERIKNIQCRRVFEAEVESVEWSYHIVDRDDITDVSRLVKEKGLSVFEIKLKRKLPPDLLTEVFAGLIQKPMVMVYLCGGELSMGTYLPAERAGAGKMCATDFYPYDAERMIELIDFDADSNKTAAQIHKRLYTTICMQKRAIMIEKAYERLNLESKKEMLSFEFSMENLDRIRADADFVQSQLRVV